jgi:UV excision repair protein RAD23
LVINSDMHLYFKTLDGKRNELEVDPAFNIGQLKSALLRELNLNVQRLVFNGRILEDSKLITEYTLKDEDTVIVMVNAARAPEPVAVAADQEDEEEEEDEEADAIFEANLKGLVDMGFDARLSARALSVSEGDAARAIQMLISGEVGQPGAGEEEDRENPLAFLLASPEFLQIRQQLVDSPGSISNFLQQLSTANPELLGMIETYYDDFLRLIGSGQDEEEQGGAGDTVDLTETELAAVRNLASLGFSMQDALEAYLSCDKNEEMAANLLFSNYQG